MIKIKLKIIIYFINIILLLCLPFMANSGDVTTNGIANKYIGDKGIESDPDVIFVENFEGGSISRILNHFTKSKNADKMSLNPDVPPYSSGINSLQMTTLGGSNPASYLYKSLPTGFDQIYIRYYIKYATGNKYSHTSVWIGGYNPQLDGPNPQAGFKPTGGDRFSIGAEPDDSDPPFTSYGSPRFDFYSYWMGMRISSDGTNYWGNDFINNSNIKTDLDKWMCIEVMVNLNSPIDSHNGELSLWIDGKNIIHLKEGSPYGKWIGNSFFPDSIGTPFEGFQWRNIEDLKINYLWIQHYVANELPSVSKVWYDDVVVAKKYIGPINTDIPPYPPTGVKVN